MLKLVKMISTVLGTTLPLFTLLIVILYPSVVYNDQLVGACHTVISYHAIEIIVYPHGSSGL